MRPSARYNRVEVTTIGVLALQGDFVEHQAVLRRLGVDAPQVRTPDELRGLDGLIVPGGESTTFCRLMQDYNLYDPLRAVVKAGLPVWGTCAGLIVLAQRVGDLESPTLEALDISARRNAYGRQVDSFEADVSIPALADASRPFHAVFIRAPVIDETGAGVEVLASLPPDGRPFSGSPIAVRQGSLLATSFHPELTDDVRFHGYFLEIARQQGVRSSPK
jgi:5'-phosphate synthase pdxT subunit